MSEPNDVRVQTLRDAYWAHREVPGRHRGECCQDRCFPDIVERWIAAMLKTIGTPSFSSDTERRRDEAEVKRWYRAFDEVAGLEAKSFEGQRDIHDRFWTAYFDQPQAAALESEAEHGT